MTNLQLEKKSVLGTFFILVFLVYMRGYYGAFHTEIMEITFQPDFYNKLYFIGRSKNSLQFDFNVNESLPNMIGNFTFCFKVNLEFLTPQPIFMSKEMSFYLYNPTKEYGFIVLNTTNRYFLKFNTITQFSWETFCILRYNNGKDSFIQVYQNSSKIFERTFKDTTYTLKRDFVKNLLFGVFENSNEPNEIQNALFRGKLAMIFATTQILTAKQIHIFSRKHGLEDIDRDLFQLSNSNFSIESKSITTKMISTRDLKVRGERVIFFVDKKMSFTDALSLCRNLNDDIQEFPKSTKGNNFIWIGHLSIKKEEKLTWAVGEPNGKGRENCYAFYSLKHAHYDFDCKTKFQFYCSTDKGITFILRGLPEHFSTIDRRYTLEKFQLSSQKEEEFVFVCF